MIPILSLLEADTSAKKRSKGQGLGWAGGPPVSKRALYYMGLSKVGSKKQGLKGCFWGLLDSQLWAESGPPGRPAQLFRKLISAAQDQIRSGSGSESRKEGTRGGSRVCKSGSTTAVGGGTLRTSSGLIFVGGRRVPTRLRRVRGPAIWLAEWAPKVSSFFSKRAGWTVGFGDFRIVIGSTQ